jgi:hypothetical protein
VSNSTPLTKMLPKPVMAPTTTVSVGVAGGGGEGGGATPPPPPPPPPHAPIETIAAMLSEIRVVLAFILRTSGLFLGGADCAPAAVADLRSRAATVVSVLAV